MSSSAINSQICDEFVRPAAFMLQPNASFVVILQLLVFLRHKIIKFGFIKLLLPSKKRTFQWVNIGYRILPPQLRITMFCLLPTFSSSSIYLYMQHTNSYFHSIATNYVNSYIHLGCCWLFVTF